MDPDSAGHAEYEEDLASDTIDDDDEGFVWHEDTELTAEEGERSGLLPSRSRPPSSTEPESISGKYLVVEYSLARLI